MTLVSRWVKLRPREVKCLQKGHQSCLVAEPGSLIIPILSRKSWDVSGIFIHMEKLFIKSPAWNPLPSWQSSASLDWLKIKGALYCFCLHPFPPGCNTNGTYHSVGARTPGECYTRFQHIILVQVSIVCAGRVWDTAPPSACPTPWLIPVWLHG